jgi:hypothetical protein
MCNSFFVFFSILRIGFLILQRLIDLFADLVDVHHQSQTCGKDQYRDNDSGCRKAKLA